MHILKSLQTLLLVVFVLTNSIVIVQAQQEFTLYHMPVLSQSTYLNPAAVPEHKLSISLPVPSVFVGFGNSALNVKSFVDKDGIVDYQNFIDGLRDKNNYLNIGANVELFNIRCKVRNNFISLHSRVVTDLRILYPKDLLGIGAEGIKDGYSLTGLGIHFNNYIEYGLGFTRAQPDSKWTYGGRLKMLHGIANIQTKKSNIELNVNQEDLYQYDLNADIEVNIAAGVDGSKVKDLEDLGDLNFAEFKDIHKLNKGFAIDVGATLQYNKRLNFGAAINNLGFINWKSYAENYKSKFSLILDGVAINNYDFSQSLDSLIDAQVDSLITSYEDIIANGEDTSRKAYKTWLPTTMFFSAHYQLNPRLRISGSIYTEFFKGVSLGVVTGLNYSTGKNVDLTASWRWFRKSAGNLGVGMVFKPGPFQFYLIMDNILPASLVRISDPETEIDGILLPYRIKNFNLRVGMNLVFGRIKDESRLPNQGLKKRKHGGKKYLYKPSLK